jgi:BMFP domain-containing protein YqiC
MNDKRLTDEQLCEKISQWLHTSLNELLELRARVAKLEARKTPATAALVNLSKALLDDANAECAELRARVTKLEAALRDCKRYAEDHDDEWVPFRVDDALQDKGEG